MTTESRENSGVELTPASASCAFYSSCKSARRDPVGCQRDMHMAIQYFCDGPVKEYIDNIQQNTRGVGN